MDILQQLLFTQIIEIALLVGLYLEIHYILYNLGKRNKR